MEYVIALGLASVIVLCLGLEPADMGMLAVYILMGVVVLSGLFFLCGLLLLITSKPADAEFVRFDDKGRFPAAIYRVGGIECRNIFPGEMMMKKRLYIEGRRKKVMKNRFFGYIIDANALITIILGAAVFIPASCAVVKIAADIWQ